LNIEGIIELQRRDGLLVTTASSVHDVPHRPDTPENRQFRDAGARKKRPANLSDVYNLPNPAAIWTEHAEDALMKADCYILPYEGRRVAPARAIEIAKVGEEVKAVLMGACKHVEPGLRERINVCLRKVAEVVAGLEEASFDLSTENVLRGQVSPRAASTPRGSPKRASEPDPPTASLIYLRETMKHFLQLICDEELPDVAAGAAVSLSECKEL